MWLYTDLLQALKGKPLSSVFSTDLLFLRLQLLTAGERAQNFTRTGAVKLAVLLPLGFSPLISFSRDMVLQKQKLSFPLLRTQSITGSLL